jgi:hypothetical protein
LIALFFTVATAVAQSSTPRTLALSIDQQNKLSEIIIPTHRARGTNRLETDR